MGDGESYGIFYPKWWLCQTCSWLHSSSYFVQKISKSWVWKRQFEFKLFYKLEKQKGLFGLHTFSYWWLLIYDIYASSNEFEVQFPLQQTRNDRKITPDTGHIPTLFLVCIIVLEFWLNFDIKLKNVFIINILYKNLKLVLSWFCLFVWLFVCLFNCLFVWLFFFFWFVLFFFCYCCFVFMCVLFFSFFLFFFLNSFLFIHFCRFFFYFFFPLFFFFLL
jgi:hypothetical protein